MLTPSKPHSSATGTISGVVLGSNDLPAAGIEVQAVYMRGWTTFYPPVPNAFIVGATRTDRQGRFKLVTSKRVDQLLARADDFREHGDLGSVTKQGNIIHLQTSK